MNKVDEIATVEKTGFRKRIVNLHVLAQAPLNKSTNLDAIVAESFETISSINPKDNLQLMLASQMTSVHNFQQKIMSYAVNTNIVDNVVKLGNLAAKLSNVFIQQAQLMKTLQGAGEKKVIFEHVHIHDGAQAVVGTVHTSTPVKE